MLGPPEADVLFQIQRREAQVQTVERRLERYLGLALLHFLTGSHFYCVELRGSPLVTAPLGLNPFVILRLFGLFGLFGLPGFNRLFGLFGLTGLPGFNALFGLFGFNWLFELFRRDQCCEFCDCFQRWPEQTNELPHRHLPRLFARSPKMTGCIN